MPQPLDVRPRVAVVTGGSRGIGRATVEALVRDGLQVLAVARGEADLREVAEATGAATMAAGLETAEGCAQVAQEAQREFGPVDVLVNNAGIDTNREQVIWEQSSEVWRETLAVNLNAPFELCRHFAGGMVERGWGRIVMVSSTAGDTAAPAYSAYCASKHGLLGLMRAVAADVGPHGVTCNAVMPGWVRSTDMSERTIAVEASRRAVRVDEVWSQVEADQPAGRVVTPSEVADTIAFLVSDRASGINGEAVRVSVGSRW